MCNNNDDHFSYDKEFEEIHVQMHNGEEKFNCSICNKLFPNKSSISLHMSAHQESRVVSLNFYQTEKTTKIIYSYFYI